MTDPFDISELVGIPANQPLCDIQPVYSEETSMEAGIPNRDTVTLYQIDGHTFTYAQYQAYLAQQEQIYNSMLAEYEAAVEEATQNAIDEAEAFIGAIEAPVSQDINDYLSAKQVEGSSQGVIASDNPVNPLSGENDKSTGNTSFDLSMNSNSPRYYDSPSIMTEAAGEDTGMDNPTSDKIDLSLALPIQEDGVDSLKDYGFFSGGITIGLEGGFSFADAEPGQDDFHEKWSNWPRKAQTRAALVRSNLYELEEL